MKAQGDDDERFLIFDDAGFGLGGPHRTGLHLTTRRGVMSGVGHRVLECVDQVVLVTQRIEEAHRGKKGQVLGLDAFDKGARTGCIAHAGGRD
jgi:hypothetical protein